MYQTLGSIFPFFDGRASERAISGPKDRKIFPQAVDNVVDAGEARPSGRASRVPHYSVSSSFTTTMAISSRWRIPTATWYLISHW